MRTLIVVTLILVLSLFYLEPVSAEITIDGDTLHVETDTYTVQFDRGVITYIHNKLTNETYTLPPGTLGFRAQTGILGIHKSVWARHATTVDAQKINPHQAEILFRQGGNEITLSIEVEAHTGDLLIGGNAVSDTAGVYGFQWGCENLDITNLKLILPVDGGQVIDASSPVTSRRFNYPGLWETQLAILQGQQGGFFVRGTDETFQFKQFNCQKDNESIALDFQTHNQAPWDILTTAKSVVWRFNTYAGDYRVPAQIYRDWMETTFKPWRLLDMPGWVQDIGLVVNGPLNIESLDRLSELVDPTKTLLYLVGWRRDGYDVSYPDYTPKEGFGDFVEYAHQHGFRVMPHVNLVGISPYHPLYPEFQSFQFRDPWSKEPIGWKWDETDNPKRHAWINNASSKFRNLLVQQLKAVWKKYRVDAFHLDISHVVVNDASGLIEGLNSARGNVLMHKELAEAMPGVVFSGEHLHEVTFFRESFAQRWKLPPAATPHPISAFLFSPYTRPYGYLGLPSLESDPLGYQNFLNSYEGWGVLPTVQAGLRELNGHLTQQILAVARQWQELGLMPDFESDWGPDTLFQYTTQTGETVTYQRTPTGSTFILPQDGGYERVYGVTEVQTHRSLPHWHAYNETTLLGLDPGKSYLLDDTPRDLFQVHINALPPGVSVTETRVTENAALFRLEKTNVSLEIDLLSELHLARTGIVMNGIELPMGRGATFIESESTLAGIAKKEIHAHPPYQGGSGDTFGEFTLPLPDSSDIRLQFYIGLWEGSQNSDGVTFIVSVQGDEIFHQHYNQQKWQPVTLNLSPYRGELVKLRFTTTPGPNGNASWDWAVWGEPEIISKPDNSLTTVGFFSPVESTTSLPNTFSHIGGGHYSLETVLPAQILFFLAPGQQVVPPYDPRDAQFTAGLQFDGIFRLGSVWNSGNRTTIENPKGERKLSISAHPPTNGQTILQFPLHLPQSQGLIFSFSMVLQDNPCSNGVLFQVLLNGQSRFEHLIESPDWVDADLSLSEFAGQTVLLELVTDPNGSNSCDWAHWADLLIIAEEPEPDGDVNQDGIVNVLDMIFVAQNLGQEPPSDSRADVNSDGQVNILDLVFVAEHLSQNAAAPAQIDLIKSIPSSAKEVIAAQRALTELEAIPNKSHGVQVAIELLRHYLSAADRNVQETKLLPNYPNPFNPDTWIPYQLSEGSTVTVKIYDVTGSLVRTIDVGHKSVGYYLTREKAVYWDGRNENGERISSGVYFYTLITDDYTDTRRMVIVK